MGGGKGGRGWDSYEEGTHTGGKILYFQRGEGGSEGNLTESDVRNPIWNWEGHPDQSKKSHNYQGGKGGDFIWKKKKKTFDIFITLAC